MSERVSSEPFALGDDVLALIDLERYPLHDLECEKGRQLVSTCRVEMAAQGWCNLAGFIRSDGLDRLAKEALGLLPQGDDLVIKRTVYGEAASNALPKGQADPRRRQMVHQARQLADDQIPADTLLKQLYLRDELTEFVRLVQGKEQLYRYADTFQALNIVALPPGGWHAWHYDYNECTVTLLLQEAEAGGVFSFLPNSRTPEGEESEEVAALLDGDLSVAKTLGRSAGTLTLFRGEYSLHGVTTVEGSRPRVTAIMTYDEQQGRVAGDEINIRIYGERAKRILTEARPPAHRAAQGAAK